MTIGVDCTGNVAVMRQALEARHREIGCLEDFPDKPKGMHWQTYDRLCRLHDAAAERRAPEAAPQIKAQKHSGNFSQA